MNGQDPTAMCRISGGGDAIGIPHARLRRAAQRWAVALYSVAGLGSVLASARSSRADAVLDWNIAALTTTAAAPFNPPVESRSLAIVHAAMFDAVNSIVGEFQPYLVAVEAAKGASPEAAATAAAHFALVQLYPDQKAALDAAYATSLALVPDGPARSDGVAVGEAVAARILAIRAGDGAEAAIKVTNTPVSEPGRWTPTPPTFLPALDAGWGGVHTFCLQKASQFRPDPPPAMTSAQYARDYLEVQDIGSETSRTRTQDQSDVARFWVATAPQIWNAAARQVAAARALTLSRTARAFALLNLAGADAFIASWEAKFVYDQWRPVTAIRAADSDGNPETIADSAWTPLLATPPFPDYIAGHTTYAGAAAEVLEHAFGEPPGVVMKLTSPTAPGVAKTYSTFEEIADAAVEARVWGGVHWRTSSARGKQVGARIARFVIDQCLAPREGASR